METLQRTANRGSISTGPYQIDNSCKFEADNSEYLSRTAGATGSATTWTASMWVKRTEIGIEAVPIGAVDSGVTTDFWRFRNTDQIRFHVYDITNTQVYYADSTAVFRDTAAWYHVILRLDSTNSDASKRLMCFVNGEALTDVTWYGAGSSSSTFGASATSLFLGQYPMHIGRATYTNGAYHSGYIAEVNVLDGIAAEPTDFGEYDQDSGIWKPKAYTGSYGTNGFYLDFKDASDLGDDESGNGNDFTENNIAAANQAVDTPTNNFAIISDAMRNNFETLYSTLTEGGTKFRAINFDTWVVVPSSIGVTKGKWYAEFKVIGARPNSAWGIISLEQINDYTNSYLGEPNKNWSIGYYQANGNLFQVQNSGSSTVTGWGAAVSQNQVVSVALDMDNHKLYMAVNNTYQNSGNPVTGANAISIDATETVAIATSGYSLGSGNDTIAGVNFGGYVTGGMYSQATDGNGYGGFRYAPPSGYYALCTKNLAEFG
jgi:hypothetical protein